MSDLERALCLAFNAHSGQKDKAGEPYILHPLRVSLSFPASDREARIVAVLHDVIEDTHVTRAQLRQAGFDTRVLEAIDALTRRPGEDYIDFILRCGANPLARRVKLADLADNMDPQRALPETAKNVARRQRYELAVRMLEGML